MDPLLGLGVGIRIAFLLAASLLVVPSRNLRFAASHADVAQLTLQLLDIHFRRGRVWRRRRFQIHGRIARLASPARSGSPIYAY